jgi:hypothetical protein
MDARSYVNKVKTFLNTPNSYWAINGLIKQAQKEGLEVEDYFFWYTTGYIEGCTNEENVKIIPKGFRSSSTADPLAKVFGTCHLLGGDKIHLGTNTIHNSYLVEFIKRFDAGFYPQLVILR